MTKLLKLMLLSSSLIAMSAGLTQAYSSTDSTFYHSGYMSTNTQNLQANSIGKCFVCKGVVKTLAEAAKHSDDIANIVDIACGKMGKFHVSQSSCKGVIKDIALIAQEGKDINANDVCKTLTLC